MSGVDFLGTTGDAGPSEDELLDTGPGPRRVPRGVVALATVLAAVGVAGAALHRTRDGAPGAPAGTTAAAAPTAEPTGVARPPTAEERALGLVRTQARDTDPLGDVVRAGLGSGSCALVEIGSVPPQVRAERALRRVLPQYTALDVGRILDANSGLCSLSLRARDRAGTTLVLTVNGPGGAGQPDTVFAREDDPRLDTATLVAVHTTRDGWAVRVGTDGPTADEPREFDLVQVAEDATLRW